MSDGPDKPEVPKAPPRRRRIVEEPIPSVDRRDLAVLENQAVTEGRLAADAAKNEHNRREELRDTVHDVSLALIKFIALLAVLGLAIVAFHWFTPPDWHFLTPAQLDKLEAVGTSAVFSGLLTVYGKKLADKL